jgi:hypothetical protein
VDRSRIRAGKRCEESMRQVGRWHVWPPAVSQI